MKQIVFLIDLSWLQDEETTVAVRFACLQILTTWPSSSCKFGYMLFNSESSRTQKVNAIDFATPTSNAVSEFESQLIEGSAAPKTKQTSVQLETLRWALSRSVTDFNWHSVTVSSPVKLSRKRRSVASLQDENRNMLFIFSQLPQGTISRIRDELLTSSLSKCLQENHIDLFWLHDSLLSSTSSAKCFFLRMRDLIQLCGVFPNETLQLSASLAPRSEVIARLLQNSKPQPLAACTLSMDCLFNPIDLSVFATQSDTEIVFDAADLELKFANLLDQPCLVSLLANTTKIFYVVSRDSHFHRILLELMTLEMVGLLRVDQQMYLLKSMAYSVGCLIKVTNSELKKFETTTEAPLRTFDSVLLEKRFKTKNTPVRSKIPVEYLDRLQEAYKTHKPQLETPKTRKDPVPEAHKEPKMEDSLVQFCSEEALLQQMRQMYEKVIEGKSDAIASIQSIVSATSHFFQNDLRETRSFFDSHFPLTLKPDVSNQIQSCELRLFVLLNFEVTSLDHQTAITDEYKEKILLALRKLIFLTSPSEVTNFVRETLASLYIETARSLLECLVEEFDLELFPDSDDDLSSKAESICEPLSGISSLGSQSNPRSTRMEPVVDPLRRMSSANLSQRQIEMPKRRVQLPKKESPTETMKKPSTRDIPTTPRGKRVLKTQVVPETPVSKQAPGRVRRTQEMLRRRSSIMAPDECAMEEENEIEESPVRPTARTPRESPRRSPRKTPRKENLTRRLMFSPQKKAFASPSAMSLLHLTTSPVLFKPSKNGKT